MELLVKVDGEEQPVIILVVGIERQGGVAVGNNRRLIDDDRIRELAGSKVVAIE